MKVGHKIWTLFISKSVALLLKFNDLSTLLSMRSKVTLEKLHKFFQRIGQAAKSPGTLYITGGATALLLGIRDQTVDIDIKFDPEPMAVFDAINNLKQDLDLNVELASPDQFVPPLPGWRERSVLISKEGPVEIRHYDFYAQALAKIERGFEQDILDVEALVRHKVIEPQSLLTKFDEIRDDLKKYPAINPHHFESKVREFVLRYFTE